MISYDDSLFPIVKTEWSGIVTDDELIECLKWGGEQLKRAERENCHIVLCVESYVTRTITSVQRAMLAENNEQSPYGPNERLAATHVVTRSRVERGILTALRWLAISPENPMHRTYVFPTVGDALDAAYALAKPQRSGSFERGVDYARTGSDRA